MFRRKQKKGRLEQKHGDVRKKTGEFEISSGQRVIDRARDLLVRSRYNDVIDLLGNPVAISSDDIVACKIFLAESCLQNVFKKDKAVEVIEALKKVLMATHKNGDDVMAYAKDLATNPPHVRAIILFPIACDIFKKNASSPNEAVDSMAQCVKKLCFSIQSLIGPGRGQLVTSGDKVAFGIECMEKMYTTIRSVWEVDHVKYILAQAQSLYWISFLHIAVYNTQKSLMSASRGIELLELQFNGNQSKYSIYGLLLYGVAVVYSNRNDVATTENYLLRAIDAHNLATDFSNENEKRECIKRVTTDLNKLRERRKYQQDCKNYQQRRLEYGFGVLDSYFN